jgi:hypothetical protein
MLSRNFGGVHRSPQAKRSLPESHQRDIAFVIRLQQLLAGLSDISCASSDVSKYQPFAIIRHQRVSSFQFEVVDFGDLVRVLILSIVQPMMGELCPGQEIIQL